MIVPVILYGSPVLRKHSADVIGEDNIKKINEVLFDTIKANEGIGLAAPQTGILKRVFVIDTNPVVEQDVSIEKFEGIFINPEIIDSESDNIAYREGCLSIPGIYEEVYRPEKILVRYQDKSLNTHEEELDCIKARIFQHEYDHLRGILFTDKISVIKRKLLTGKLNRIRKLSQSQKTEYYADII